MNETINERVATLEQCQKTTSKDIAEIKNKLLGRPSWAVCVIITFLTTTTTGLLIFILR